MKSIRDFLASKIRRSEAGDVLELLTEGRAPGELGAFEGALVSERGRADFFENGLELADGTTILYDSIERVLVSHEAAGERFVDIVTPKATHRIRATAAGGAVLHATLRWIGHTKLRRDLAG